MNSASPDQAAPSAFSRWLHRRLQGIAIAMTAFLTLIDLFAVQAILPSLAVRYQVSPAEIGAAANACTLGMAVASLVAAVLSEGIDRRIGIALSLTLLAIPTAALAFVNDLTLFTLLRVAQGCLMATAFVLMLAYLGEHFSRAESAMAFAAFVAGNVLSNLAGRMLSAQVSGNYGLETTFLTFAALNLLGAVLVVATVSRAAPMSKAAASAHSGFAALKAHILNRELRVSFAIGFLILFTFIGVFTFVNFVLVAAPLNLGMTQLGWVYFVFAPSLFTTLMAGWTAALLGARRALWLFLGIIALGLPLLLVPNLGAILVGLALVAIGAFAAQAVATGHVGATATMDRGAASGLYLCAYFSGGLIGSLVLGRVYEAHGWQGCVLAIGGAVLLAGLLTIRLAEPPAMMARPKLEKA